MNRENLRAALRDALIRIAMSDPDPAERRAKIEILKKDGWL